MKKRIMIVGLLGILVSLLAGGITWAVCGKLTLSATPYLLEVPEVGSAHMNSITINHAQTSMMLIGSLATSSLGNESTNILTAEVSLDGGPWRSIWNGAIADYYGVTAAPHIWTFKTTKQIDDNGNFCAWILDPGWRKRYIGWQTCKPGVSPCSQLSLNAPVWSLGVDKLPPSEIEEGYTHKNHIYMHVSQTAQWIFQALTDTSLSTNLLDAEINVDTDPLWYPLIPDPYPLNIQGGNGAAGDRHFIVRTKSIDGTKLASIVFYLQKGFSDRKRHFGWNMCP